jgi:hypothetical protein
MQLYVVLIQCFGFPPDGIHQQFHQPVHLILRAVPIFRAECIKGQEFNAKLGTALYNVAYTFYPMKMAKQAILPLFLRPPSIAIHNDGYMAGKLPFVQHFQ